MTLMQTLTTVAITLAVAGSIYSLLDARAGGQQPEATTSRSRELNEEADSELSCKSTFASPFRAAAASVAFL